MIHFEIQSILKYRLALVLSDLKGLVPMLGSVATNGWAGGSALVETNLSTILLFQQHAKCQLKKVHICAKVIVK
jgi:hypothetical protein